MTTPPTETQPILKTLRATRWLHIAARTLAVAAMILVINVFTTFRDNIAAFRMVSVVLLVVLMIILVAADVLVHAARYIDKHRAKATAPTATLRSSALDGWVTIIFSAAFCLALLYALSTDLTYRTNGLSDGLDSDHLAQTPDSSVEDNVVLLRSHHQELINPGTMSDSTKEALTTWLANGQWTYTVGHVAFVTSDFGLFGIPLPDGDNAESPLDGNLILDELDLTANFQPYSNTFNDPDVTRLNNLLAHYSEYRTPSTMSDGAKEAITEWIKIGWTEHTTQTTGSPTITSRASSITHRWRPGLASSEHGNFLVPNVRGFDGGPLFNWTAILNELDIDPSQYLLRVETENTSS